MPTNLPWELMAGGAGGAVALFLYVLLTRYRKVGPNEALIISGWRGERGRGFRIRKGGGTFVMPFLEEAKTLSLEVMTIHVHTPEVYTLRGVPVQVDGIAQIKIDSSDEALIGTAAEQFLGRSGADVMNVALQTVEGHLRAILGTMEVEDIYKDREQFAANVAKVSASDFKNMGLKIVSFTLKDIKDAHGYLDALGKPRLAEVKRDAAVRESMALSEAQIAQAEANRNASIKSAQARKDGEIERFKAEAQIAEASRDFELKRADYQAAVNEKKATADLAYDLQRYKTNQLVKKEEIQVATVEKEQQIQVQEREILRRQKELEATVQKPAEAKRSAMAAEADAEKYKLTAEAQGRAEAQRAQGLAEAEVILARGKAQAEAARLLGEAEAEVIRAKGLAEAESMRKKAESYQNYGAAAVTEMFTQMLPLLAKAVAEPLSKLDRMTVISTGGDGANQGTGSARITQDVATIMAQLPAVVESLSGISLKDIVGRIPGLVSQSPSAPSPTETAAERVQMAAKGAK
ncbi:MAG: SPFH domain-containing protein [Myxococcota bacterium]|nr:SPFH domain-containing protein [Myxococcota bacterium]